MCRNSRKREADGGEQEGDSRQGREYLPNKVVRRGEISNAGMKEGQFFFCSKSFLLLEFPDICVARCSGGATVGDM